MIEDVESESTSFHDDMISIANRLPDPHEYRRVRHLILQGPANLQILDDELAAVFRGCPHIETAILSGVHNITDRTVITLAENAINLQELDLSGCSQVTDVAISEMTSQSLPLQSIRLNGAVCLTDSSITSIARTCLGLMELDIGDLPLLSALGLRDVWSFSRKLRTLHLAHCIGLTDKAFPSFVPDDASINSSSGKDDKPLPHRPITILEVLPPLLLRHRAENLRVLDLTGCKITDDAIDGIVCHAPRIQTLILSGCTQLTDYALECITRLQGHLDVLMLAHVPNITDRGVIALARHCINLRCVDVAFCRNLTDLTVFELASLNNLRRLSLVRIQKLTDIAIFALAEHATGLERLHLSYCDRLSLEAVHMLMKKLVHLEHLTATGIPSFKRKGIQRFSETPPASANLDPAQQAVYRVFTGPKVDLLRKFLDKEEARKREAEMKNIRFVPRSDDKLDLY